MLLKPHQYISIAIVVFIILAVLWPLIVHAVTEDEVLYYASPIELIALRPATGAPAAPKLLSKRVLPSKPRIATYQHTEGILGRIADCESQGNLYAKNPRSTAKGKYQFLDGSWRYYGQKLWGDEWVSKNVFSERDQDELAEYVVSVNGYKDWEASAYCWR